MLPWDNWWELGTKEDDQVTADDRKFLDQIAAAINGLDSTSMICACCSMTRDSAARCTPGCSCSGSPLEQPRRRTAGRRRRACGSRRSSRRPMAAANRAPHAGEPKPAYAGPTLRPPTWAGWRAGRAPGSGNRSRIRPGQQWPRSHGSNGYANGHIDPDVIVVRGAQQHNLKHINVTIPRNKLVVLTGVCGSGQVLPGLRYPLRRGPAPLRREPLGLRAPLPGPDGQAQGRLHRRALSPAIAIEQKSVSKNPRSTVGTVTEVMDYLRVLFSRAGHAALPAVRARDRAHLSPQQVADRLVQLPPGTRFQLLAPLARNRKGDHAAAAGAGPRRTASPARASMARCTTCTSPRSCPNCSKAQPHTIEIVVDRLVVPAADATAEPTRKDFAVRLIDSVETALRAGKGTADRRPGATARSCC